MVYTSIKNHIYTSLVWGIYALCVNTEVQYIYGIYSLVVDAQTCISVIFEDVRHSNISSILKSFNVYLYILRQKYIILNLDHMTELIGAQYKI